MTRSTPRGRLRSTLSLVLVAVVVLGGAVIGAHSASGTSSFNLTRVAGSDRYQTSAALVQRQFSNAPTVILASGATYPDALAAAFLAGNLGAPVLLTTPDLPMSSATTQELQALGARNVVLLGGTAAISQAEQNQLAQSYSVTRLAGNTRYDTMQAIDTAPGTAVGTANGAPTAFLATGQDFPDALGAGPISYSQRLPIVLTQGQSLSPQAASTLSSLGIRQVMILGGTAAISAGVEQQVNGMGITTLVRFAGVDRSDTSRLVAEYALQNFGFKNTLVNVASGDESFGGADALSLGSVGGKEDPVPTLITPSVNSAGAVLTYANNHASTLTGGIAAGGPGPLPDAVVLSIDSAGQSSSTTTSTTGSTTTTTTTGGTSPGTSCSTSTSSSGTGSAAGSGTNQRPTLSSVSFVSVVPPGSASPGNPAGTTLTFTFDHPINGAAPNAADFLLVPFNTGSAAAAGGTATISASSTNAVNVLFPTVTNQTQLNGFTVANVLQGAVVEPSNPPSVPGPLTNPEGDAPIGSPVPPQAGNTIGPDLKSGSNFRPALGAGTFAIDLSFDCAVVTTTAGSGTFNAGNAFHLVLVDNTTVTCSAPETSNPTASGQNVPGGSTTNLLTIVCPEPGTGAFAGSPYSAANVARIWMDPGTVTDAATQTTVNPLESAFLSGGATATGGQFPGSPDLTSVAFAPNVTVGGTTVDQVTYTFDKTLFQNFDPTKFVVFRQDGSEFTSATPPAFSSGSSTSVVVTFPQGTLINAVGASVRSNAVQGTNGNFNLPESVPATGETVSGVTAAPNLTSESMPTATTVVFNFDRAVTVVDATKFHLYENNPAGTEIGCGGAVAGAGSQANQVTCTFTAPPAGTAVTLGTVSSGAVSGPESGTGVTVNNTSVFSAPA